MAAAGGDGGAAKAGAAPAAVRANNPAAKKRLFVIPAPFASRRHASIGCPVSTPSPVSFTVRRAIVRGPQPPPTRVETCSRSFAACFTLALLLAAGVALAAAEVKPYARDDLASDVVRLTETLRKETAQIGAKLKGKSVEQLRKDAASAVAAGNYKDAGALARRGRRRRPQGLPRPGWRSPSSAPQADDAQATGRYDLVERGQTAAYAAYQRATGAPQQAEALALLGDLFARHEMWRPALDAYRASLDRHDDEDARKVYEDMREKHGFRIVDYKVDNESSAPRICFNFSESLARKTDFTPYVAVAGSADTAISAEDQQICVEGVKHGERYAIVLRQGLPSAVGESLLKDADYEVYVRDRSPQAHFAGRAYVLPRQGQLGAPLTTVNTAKVSIDVYRIGDRNLLAETARDDFLKPITLSRASEIESQDGVKVWSGTMDVASELNQDVVTDFPIAQGGRQARPRRLSRHRAAVEGRERAGDDQRRRPGRATRDAMDGRFRPRPDDLLRRRRHPRARAFARHRPAAVGRRGAADRAQQRSAGDQVDRRRRRASTSIPACRAEPAARPPACWWRRSATTTASSISASRPSTSPIAASPAATRRARSTPSSTPSAASIARARRCSSPRCCATRRARPRPACR